MARAGAAGGNDLPREGVVLLGPATGARGAAALPTPGGRGSRRVPLSHLLPEGAGRCVPAACARREPCRRRSPRGSERRNGSARWGGPSHAGGTSSRPRGGRLADLPAGSSPRPPQPYSFSHLPRRVFTHPFLFVFWFFFCLSEILSRPSRHSKSGRSEAEETAAAEARRREADRREAADRLREAEEAAQEAVRARQAEEAAWEEARLRRAEESVRGGGAARAPQAASQAPDPTPPEAMTTSEATHDEAAGAPLGPDPSGDAQDEPASGDVPESGTSIGGPSRAASLP